MVAGIYGQTRENKLALAKGNAAYKIIAPGAGGDGPSAAPRCKMPAALADNGVILAYFIGPRGSESNNHLFDLLRTHRAGLVDELPGAGYAVCKQRAIRRLVVGTMEEAGERRFFLIVFPAIQEDGGNGDSCKQQAHQGRLRR